MNPFAQGDDQLALADSLRKLLEDLNAFDRRRARLSGPAPDRMALWPVLAEQGVIAAAFDEAHGGFAGDPRTVAVIMSELGAALAVEPFLVTAVMAGRILRHCADQRAAQSLIDPLIAGDTVIAFAHRTVPDAFADPLVRLVGEGASARLEGALRAVPHADVAHSFLVPALNPAGGVDIWHVPRSLPGLKIDSYRALDASGAGDLCFNSAAVGAGMRLALDADGRQVLDEALQWGILGLTAETAGIVQALNARTFEYLMTRKQFGTVIGSFQALQHRAADMWIVMEELLAMMELAIEELSADAGASRAAVLSAAKFAADRAGRRVGNEAVQMHGGMGVSDELIVSHYFRRLAALRACLGNEDSHKLRFRNHLSDLSQILLANEAPELRAWRQEVRSFVQASLPADIALRVERGLKLHKQDFVRWQKVLYSKGWFAGAWPRESGGQGWNLRKQLVFTQEAALLNAPMLIPYGLNMVGPVLNTFGLAEQRREHLPGILSSDVWWCQGYSEPGSGSDLASLRTFAERDGDHYLVNGGKMWTTEAHWADMMHCLVRTDRNVKAQAGITFLIIDMTTPGITISPIVTIDGIHHTNQVFFDNVRVPVSNRVGEEGQGWTIAKFLLGNERTSIADTGPKLRSLRHLRALRAQLDGDASVTAAARALLDAKLADVEMQLLILCAMERRYIAAWDAGAKIGAEASLMKIRGTEILQAMSELAMEMQGAMALAHDPADLLAEAPESPTAAQLAGAVAHEYLYARCWSIFGGTNEIQRNIIARQILG